MAPAGDQVQPADYLRVVRARKLTIATVTLLAVGAALAVALLQDPVYQATAEVLVRQTSSASLFSGSPAHAVDPGRTLQTEIRVLNGPEVRAAVAERLGRRAPTVSATAVKDADVIRITAGAGEARMAANVANAYAEAYTELKRKHAVDEVLAASREIQLRINELQSQIDSAAGTDRDALVQAQAVFRQKLGEAQVGGALNSGGARVVAPASVPASPASPKPVRSALWSLSFGLVLGVGVAFLRDYLDDRIRSKDDLERATDLPTMGLIPLVGGRKEADVPRPVALTEPQSISAEAFRTVRTAVQYVDVVSPKRVIQITSATTREGKTTVAANLGVVLAKGGQRVVVVCCDLRRPRLHLFFDLPNDIGLTSVFLGEAPLNAALRQVASQPRLYVLPSGPLPPNPAELLGSDRAAETLAALRHHADVVILDCPPILPVTDALVLSPRSDAVLLVARAGATSRKGISRALELLRQVNAPLVGTILNGVAGDETYEDAYAYYQSADASGNGESPARARRRRRSGTTPERS
ncbi:MAG: polysaccharide biosynthesis tyrosine autokinase [Actinomycetota bacterium]|nr:polysaccharide biosynthesis tyrosine autokinase [Actinomycetota bacterium]